MTIGQWRGTPLIRMSDIEATTWGIMFFSPAHDPSKKLVERSKAEKVSQVDHPSYRYSTIQYNYGYRRQ
jgi:hypothetical protein